MITDDEVLDLFQRADPARADDLKEPVDAAAYLDGLRSRDAYVPAAGAATVAIGPTRGARWRIITAVAAAGVLVVGAVVLAARTDPAGPEADRTPVVTDAPHAPTNPAAVALANDFTGAFGALDADSAIAYLAEGADVSEVTAPGGVSPAIQTRRDLRSLIGLLEAQGYQQRPDPCEVTSDSGPGTELRCPVAFSSLRSDRYAPGPYDQSHIDLTVRRGEIVRAATTWATDQFGAEVWDPFAAWVGTRYPADAAVMYTDGDHERARLTEPSARLWDQHTRRYAAAEGAAMVRVAEAFMAARDTTDGVTALSLMADDGVRAQLCNQELTPQYACVVDDPEEPIMGRVELDRAALTFAFDAEALLGYRFEAPSCEKASGPLVTCSYRMDTRLRRIAGYPPVDAASSVGVVDGRVQLVTFPWLNVAFNPGGYNPVDAEPFARWLETAHPYALGNGPVFVEQGQDLILQLNWSSLNHLASYLDEYSAVGRAPGPTADPDRLWRRVAGVPFSLVAPLPDWSRGPIEHPPDLDWFRTRDLYVSQSTVGPQGAEAVVFWTSVPERGGLASPCERLLGPSGELSASELAGVIAAAPGTDLVEGPTEVTIDGQPTQHVTVTVRDDRGCDPGYFFSWQDEFWGPAWTVTNRGDTIDVWVVNVAGTLLVFEAETTPQASVDVEQQVQAIIDSIRFES